MIYITISFIVGILFGFGLLKMFIELSDTEKNERNNTKYN